MRNGTPKLSRDMKCSCDVLSCSYMTYVICLLFSASKFGNFKCLCENLIICELADILEDFENTSLYFCTFLANRICDGKVTSRF